jgi:translation initiation factor 3 subunit F
VPYAVNYTEPDHAGVEALALAKDSETRTTTVMTEIENLERALEDTVGMLDRVAKYVENVIEEEEEPSTALGQFLLNTLALAPKVEPADIEKDFNNHVQDVLTVSYLANMIRTQMDLSNRLATAQLTMGGAETSTADKGNQRQNRQGGGQTRQNRAESLSVANI